MDNENTEHLDSEKFTRSDYLKLPEGFPAEMLRGQLAKEPMPSPWHQVVVGRLTVQLGAVAGPNRIVFSPYDLFVDDENVVKPDLVVLPEGARVGTAVDDVPLPDVVVEVLSPLTRDRDRGVKTGIYLDAGVAEVWLIDWEKKGIELMTPLGSVKVPVSAVIPGFRPDAKTLFS